MITTREQLLQQVLALPAADQAYLVQSVEDHLIAQTPAEIDESAGTTDQEFLAALQRRSAAYQAGQVSSRSATDAMADFRQRQADEKSR